MPTIASEGTSTQPAVQRTAARRRAAVMEMRMDLFMLLYYSAAEGIKVLGE